MDEKAKKSFEVLRKAWDFAPPMGNDLQRAISLYEKAIEIDSRNISAYYGLANIYTNKLDDLEKAEYYCKKGYEVTDIPSEISKPSIGVDDIRAESDDDFDKMMVMIRLKQGKIEEAKEYIDKMKIFFDKYSKGNYHVALNFLNEYQNTSSKNKVSSAKASKSGCLIPIIILIFILVMLIFLSLLIT